MRAGARPAGFDGSSESGRAHGRRRRRRTRTGRGAGEGDAGGREDGGGGGGGDDGAKFHEQSIVADCEGRMKARSALRQEVANDVEHAVDARSVQGHPAVDDDVLAR